MRLIAVLFVVFLIAAYFFRPPVVKEPATHALVRMSVPAGAILAK